jgi:hypothetical protein
MVAVLALQYVQGSVLRGLTNGQLEAADYWQEEPAILSAGLGFDNIIDPPAPHPPAAKTKPRQLTSGPIPNEPTLIATAAATRAWPR